MKPRRLDVVDAAARKSRSKFVYVTQLYGPSAPLLLGAATFGSSGPSYSRQTDSLEGALEHVRRLGAADLHGVPARLANNKVRHAADAPRFL